MHRALFTKSRALFCFVVCTSFLTTVGCSSGNYMLVQRFDGTGAIDTSLNSGVPITRRITTRPGRSGTDVGLVSLGIDAQDLIAIALAEAGTSTAELRNFSGTPFSRFGGIVSAGFDTTAGTGYAPSDLAVVRGSRGTLGTGFVVVGTRTRSGSSSVALAKFDIDGLDMNFGFSGRVVTAHPDLERNIGFAIAFDNAGRIVVVGWAGRETGGPHRRHNLILRYMPDGRLDTTFGTSGSVLDESLAANWVPLDIAIDAANRIVVGSRDSPTTNQGMRIRRYLPDGRVDRGFGTDGSVLLPVVGTLDLYTGPPVLAIDNLGRIVAATTTDEVASRAQIARFLSSGAIDRSFGSAGSIVTDSPSRDGFRLADVGVDSRNRIVVCGDSSPDESDGVDSRLIVARYSQNGRLDTSFSRDGFAVSDLTNSSCRALAISGNRITVGGNLVR